MADEATRDEAVKCKQIAQNALAAGDSEKATRFLQKVKRMNPLDPSIDALLQQAAKGGLRERTAPAQQSGGSANNGPTPASGSSTGGVRTGKDGRNYTPEQMQIAQRILRTKDYYEILEVPRDASDEVIKKAYKKIALKLHPDKNKAPGSEEAFKKVSKAVQCLTCEDKKRVYDRYGDEDRIPQQHRHYHQDFTSPEDLFQNFFGAGFQSERHHQRGNNEGTSEQAQRQVLLQLLPIILLVVLSLASQFVAPNSPGRFSFERSNSFSRERVTPTLDVTYYVADDFYSHYAEGTHNLQEFERQVEIYHVRNLHSQCDLQEKTMYKKVMMAKRRNDPAEVKQARAHPRPACKALKSVEQQHSRIYRAAIFMGHVGF